MKIAYKIYPKEIKSNKDLLLNHFFNNIFSSYSDILSEEPMPLNDILKYPYSSILSLLNIIPEDSQIRVVETPRFVFNKNNTSYCFSIFNPFNSHIIASSCFDHSIQIWSVTRQMMHIVSCKNVITKMSWQENGMWSWDPAIAMSCSAATTQTGSNGMVSQKMPITMQPTKAEYRNTGRKGLDKAAISTPSIPSV